MNSCRWNSTFIVKPTLILGFMMSSSIEANESHTTTFSNMSSGIINSIHHTREQTNKGDALTGEINIDRFEYVTNLSDGHEQAARYEISTWYGNDKDNVLFITEGELIDTNIESSEHKLLWQHNLNDELSLLLGLHWIKEGDYSREAAILLAAGELSSRLAYEMSASVSNSDPTIFNLEIEDQWQWADAQSIFTTFGVSGYSKNDLDNGIASGPSELMLEMYNEYRVNDSFATYIGLSYTKLLGNSAKLAREENESTHQWDVFVGLSLAF